MKTLGIIVVGFVILCCLVVVIGCGMVLLGRYNNERMEDKQ